MAAKILWWIYIPALACAIILTYGMVENLMRKWMSNRCSKKVGGRSSHKVIVAWPQSR